MAEDTGTPQDKPEVESPETDKPTGLTQEEVDRIVESRLARERKKYEGFDEIKEKADRLDEIERENQTELERAQTEAREAREEAENIRSSSSEIVARSTLLQEIAKPEHKIVDPEGAVEFLLGVDRDLVTFDDSGKPTNVGEAVEKLTGKRSYLVNTEVKPPSDADLGARGGSKPDQLTEADLHSMSPIEIVKARGEGRLDDVLSGKQ